MKSVAINNSLGKRLGTASVSIFVGPKCIPTNIQEEMNALSPANHKEMYSLPEKRAVRWLEITYTIVVMGDLNRGLGRKVD